MCGISDKNNDYNVSHETDCDDCEMCESQHTFVGTDLHFLTNVDLRFLLIVDGNTVYVTSLQFSSKCVIESCNCL